MIRKEQIRKFEKLVARNSDDEQKLPTREIVKGVLRIAEDESREHSFYQHYTSMRAFRKIFNPVAPGLLLSRIDSLRLNDRNEWRKYAVGTAPNAFIGCFSHVSAESANLWWLYAQGNRQSLRISFPRAAFCAWCDGMFRCVASAEMLKDKHVGCTDKMRPVSWMDPIVSDVVYLAVKGERDRYPQKRQNVMSWEDCRGRVDGLSREVFGKGLIGRFKDYEWKDERETRVILQMRNFDANIVKVGIPLDSDIISQLRITINPWASQKDVKEVRDEVEILLRPFGWKLTKRAFRESVLSGAVSALRR